MKTDNQSIEEVLSRDVAFFIPPFQRGYAWGKQEIERYFNDVSRVIDSELDSEQKEKLEHFFGTLVIKPDNEGFDKKYIIVDGQQRLTTTLLFLVALRDLEGDTKKTEIITNKYLTNGSSTFPDKIKLKQVTKDWDSYKSLINGDNNSASGVINNAYKLFKVLINERKRTNPDITLRHYITAIQRMNVAIIFLDERPFKGEDAQIIFETLNSLGKPLTLSDLVRNYILLNMESNHQTYLYENTWSPKIENILNEYTSKFLRDFLQLKKSTSIKAISDNNTKEIYHIFKEFVAENYKCHFDFIKDITPYAKWYSWIVKPEPTDTISINKENNKIIKELIRNIFHDINTEALKPLVLGFLQHHQENIANESFNDAEFISLLQVIRTYLIRRRVLGLAQGENKEMPRLCKDIPEMVSDNTKLVERLSNMFYGLRFPNDLEIRKELLTTDFYNKLKKYCTFILGKMEETTSKVPVNFRNKKITIERIMPQTLNNNWQEELGEDYEEVHKKYLHNIGNIILTEFNSEMGNIPFAEKKSKLSKSNLSYRNFVLEQDSWNGYAIEEHSELMIKIFLKTFPLPEKYQSESNWNTEEVQINSIYPLDSETEDTDASGLKPAILRIEGKEIKVKTWQDVLIGFIKYIKDSDNYDFSLIIEKQSDFNYKNDIIVDLASLSQMINDDSDIKKLYKSIDGKSYDKIDSISKDLVFIHTNISANACIQRLANIMNIYYMPEESVEIILK